MTLKHWQRAKSNMEFLFASADVHGIFYLYGENIQYASLFSCLGNRHCYIISFRVVELVRFTTLLLETIGHSTTTLSSSLYYSILNYNALLSGHSRLDCGCDYNLTKSTLGTLLIYIACGLANLFLKHQVLIC